jgi:hypothetical protein
MGYWERGITPAAPDYAIALQISGSVVSDGVFWRTFSR